MRPLSPSELLDAWEDGIHQPTATRTLGLLAAACAQPSVDAIATLTVGERDRRLLQLRQWTFGPELMSVAACPGCGERLEWSAGTPQSDWRREAGTDDFSLEAAGYSARFRLPNSMDLAAAATVGELDGARSLLLQRCLLEVHHEGEPIPAGNIPASVADAIAGRMGEIDGEADTEFELACPVCAHRWTVVFDIESFFWRELTAWAQRVLRDVHALASAYGWREADILHLGQWRRQFYLNLVGG